MPGLRTRLLQVGGAILRSRAPYNFMKKLGKIQTRVAIARDVLLQLKLNLVKPICGTYIQMWSGPLAELAHGTDAQPILLNRKRKPCTVCALGAGVVSLIRRENNFHVGDQITPYTRLGKYFEREQLVAIESLFEGWQCDRKLPGNPKARMRWLWSYVAKYPRFTDKQIYAAAGRTLNKSRR